MRTAPNILLIMVDELAPQVLPMHGHQVVRAPHITRLAQAGAVFDSAYTNSPLCAPARASLLTGRLTPDIGAWDNGAELQSELPTIAHYLRAAGYDTALSGKMHFVGPDQLHGYQERLTTDIYPADFSWTANWSRPPTDPNPAGVSMRPVLEAGPSLRNLQVDYDEEVQFEARKWLWNRARDRDNHKPFFLTVSYTHPHPPFVALQEYWDMYRPEDIDLPRVATLPPDRLDPASLGLYYNHRRNLMPVDTAKVIDARRAYYGMVTWVDAQIGDLLSTLRASGLDDNTAIVFTSDHGEMLGERGMWFKMSMYEWSVRVPMVVSWPGRLAAGRVARNVWLVDLLPTLLDLGNTGAPEPVQAVEPLAGRSLLPLITEPDTPDWPDLAVSDFTAGGVPGPLRMVKQGSLKLILTGGHQPMLFDLAADPDELNDLARDPGAAQSLATMMELAGRDYDPARIDAAVRESQKRRLLIREVESRSGSAEPWNWKVYPNDDQRYVRAGGLQHGEHATKARARFPHVPEAD